MKQQTPTVFHDEDGQILGVIPAASDRRQVRLELFKGSVQDKCLVLDIQAKCAVVMKASDAIGLDPCQYVLLQTVAFASLFHQGLAEANQGQIYQRKLRSLKLAIVRLAFWRTR